MTLDVRLLGQLAVIRDGHRLELRSRPVQRLLAYLVLHLGQSIARDKLAGVLWPGSTPARARKNLRQTLWRLRRVVGDEHLEVSPQSLRLVPEGVTSDVAKLQGHDVGDEPNALVAAVESYRGELLPGHYEEWVQAAGGPLRSAYEDRMCKLLRLLADQERWDELRYWSERWIAQGSVAEPAYRALMQAHAGFGDSAGVADAYHRCVDMLRSEIGAGPSAQTRALYRRLTHDWDALADAGKGAADQDGSVVPMPSVRRVGSKAVIEHSAIIRRPHDEVYSTLLDPDTVPLYRANVLEYQVIAGAAGRAGARVRVTRKLGTEVIEILAEAIEAEEGRWIKSRTFDSPIDVELETRFEDVESGTRMTHCRVLEVPRDYFGGLGDSVTAQLYAGDMRSDVENLKVLLETR